MQGAQPCCVFFWAACNAAELSCLGLFRELWGDGCVSIPQQDTGVPGCGDDSRWNTGLLLQQPACLLTVPVSLLLMPLVSCSRKHNIWPTPCPALPALSRISEGWNGEAAGRCAVAELCQGVRRAGSEQRPLFL